MNKTVIKTAGGGKTRDSTGAKEHKTANKKTRANFNCEVTFGSQVGRQRVSVVVDVAPSLHTGWRHVPRVRIRLIDV